MSITRSLRTIAVSAGLLLLFAIGFRESLSAQVVETKRLTLSNNRYLKIIVDDSGNVFTANDSVCVKYDTSFVQQWTTNIPHLSASTPWVMGFTQDNQGNLLILKEEEIVNPVSNYTVHPRVTKIGSDGSIHWSQRYDNPPGYSNFSSYSRGPFNFWTDDRDNIYLSTRLNVKVAGNCWSDTYFRETMRAWLFSLAPSGSKRWDVVKSVDVAFQLNARPRGFASDGSCYIWNDVILDNCWSSNANSNCNWLSDCYAEHTSTLSRYNPNGTETFETPLAGSKFPVVAPSGNYYLWGNNGPDISKHTPDGSTVWSVTTPEDRVMGIKLSDDESYMLVRSGTYIPTGPDNGYNRTKDQCFNANGSLLWQTTDVLPKHLFPGINNNVFDLENSLFYAISGVDGLTCIDLSNGQRSWTQNIGGMGYLSRDMQGRFYATGSDGPPTFNMIVTRYVLAGELTVFDANKDALSDKEFYLIRVADDAPLFTPDTLGIVKTDADGKIQLTPVP